MDKLILDVDSIKNLELADTIFLPIFINLPTYGLSLDSTRITYPLKLTSHNVIMIMCLIDNHPYWLIWTNALEVWFFESKIRMLFYSGTPCIQFIPLFVNNLPLL